MGGMARPLRPQWRERTLVRRRHRTWMAAMVLATAGWGVWWTALVLHRFYPDVEPLLAPATWIASAFAAVGLFLAVFTVRARLIWILLAGVPVFANATLLLGPLLLREQLVQYFNGPVTGTADEQP